MVYQYQNFGLSTLDEALDDTETGVDVVNAASFPTSGDFVINVEGELMKVTAVTSNTFTVERGVEGSTAVAHPIGATVKNVLTADMVSLPSTVSGTYVGDGNDLFTRTPIDLPFPCALVWVIGTPTSGNYQVSMVMRGAGDGIRHVYQDLASEALNLRMASDGLSFTPSAVGVNGVNESGTTYYYVGLRDDDG